MIETKPWVRYELLVLTDKTDLPIRWRRQFSTRNMTEKDAIAELRQKLHEANAYMDNLSGFIDIGHRRNRVYMIVKCNVTPICEID